MTYSTSKHSRRLSRSVAKKRRDEYSRRRRIPTDTLWLGVPNDDHRFYIPSSYCTTRGDTGQARPYANPVKGPTACICPLRAGTVAASYWQTKIDRPIRIESPQLSCVRYLDPSFSRAPTVPRTCTLRALLVKVQWAASTGALDDQDRGQIYLAQCPEACATRMRCRVVRFSAI